MNKLLSIISLLAAGEEDEIVNQGYKRFIGIVNIVLPVLMSILLVLGMFYGITIGVKYAKAEEDDEKKKTRGQLINVIVGILIAIVFVAVIQIILNGQYVEKLFEDTSENLV